MPDVAHILSLLESSDPESIREGAHLAGAAKLEEAIPALVSHATSANIGVLEAVDRALRKIGGSSVVHAVIPLLRSDEPPVRNLAMDLLRALGTSDLDALFQLLHDDDSDVRIFAADILGAVGSPLAVPHLCHSLLHDPEVNVVYQAAVSLGTLAFPEAAPCLNRALQHDEWVQFAVIEALTKIRDESSVRPMIQALANASDLVASTIVDALGEMGNIKAVPLLLRLLERSSAPLRNKILKAVVGIMGENSLTLLGTKECERLRDYMLHALEDEDEEIQNAVVRGLSAIGGSIAAPALLKLVSTLSVEKDAERIATIIDALARVGQTPELVEALRSDNEEIRLIAMEALLRADEETAVPLLMEVFWESPRDLQRSMMAELAMHAGPHYQEFFLDVLDQHNDGTVLRGALLFLGQKGNPEEAQDKILPMLQHPYNDVKESALEACIALHTPAIEEYFRELTRDADPLQRMMAVYALGFFPESSFIEEFRFTLEDESAEVRKVTVESLARDCPIPEENLYLIKSKMDDENSEVRMAVVEALGLCSDAGLDESLLMGLNDPDPWVRVRCAERLGERCIEHAVEPLVAMLHDSNHLIVVKAIEALGMIGGETAFRALLTMLDHEVPDLQEAAEAAIETIRRQAGE